MIATIWEVWNDRHGDLNKSTDVYIRIVLLWVEAFVLKFIFHKPSWAAFILSSAIFFMFFDYLVTYVLIRNKVIEVPGAHWFTYTAKGGLFDNMEWWKFSPWIRFGVKLAYFFVSLVLFIKL